MTIQNTRWISGERKNPGAFSHSWILCEAMKMLALITQLAITMLTALLICGRVGYVIDEHFGTNTLIFFLILGVLGGYKACYNIIKKFIEK
jgi:F0F1-type ATP synthase assembly protein I